MNEFIIEKLGEVLAFATVGNETLEKGAGVLEDTFGAEKVKNAVIENRIHAEQILKINPQAKEFHENTAEKLRAMRDIHLGHQWDTPIDLMEWCGFFEGAALVHWRIIEGAGEAMDSEEIMELAEAGLALHQELFDTVGAYLQEIGQAKTATI